MVMGGWWGDILCRYESRSGDLSPLSCATVRLSECVRVCSEGCMSGAMSFSTLLCDKDAVY